MKMNSQLHTPTALPSRDEAPVPIQQEIGWAPRAGLNILEKIKKLTLPEIETRLAGRSSHHHHHHHYHRLRKYAFCVLRT
jgi:hypothetical protein